MSGLRENPIITRETSARVRSRGTSVALTGFLVAVAAVAATLFALAAVGSPGHNPGAGQMQRVAYHAISFQLVLLMLVAPALGAGAIARERTARTFDLLVVGQLSPGSIVVGKLVAAVAYLLLFALAALPLYVTIFLHAGLGLGPLAIAELLTVVAAVAGVSIGMFLGSLNLRLALATLAACSLALTLSLDIVLAELVPAPGTGLAQTTTQLLDGLSGQDTTAVETDDEGRPVPITREDLLVHPVRVANPLYALNQAVADPRPDVDADGIPLGRLGRLAVPGGEDFSTWGPGVQPWQLSVVTALAVSVLLLAGTAQQIAGPRPRRRGRERSRAAPPSPEPEPGPERVDAAAAQTQAP